MFKILIVILFALVCIDANCLAKPKYEYPEQNSLDIKIFGKKVKLNIIEIKEGNQHKDNDVLDTLKDQILNRKKRSDDSVIDSAKNIANKVANKIKEVATKAKDTYEMAKTAIGR